MDKEKQIEEMARDLCRLSCTCEECQTVPSHKKDKCKAKVYAKRAYDKDYRKASEVAREIFEEIDKIVIRKVIHHGEIAYDVTDEYAELKKKYTESEKDNG